MEKQPKEYKITSTEELIYNILVLVGILGSIYGIAKFDSYKTKKNHGAKMQSSERLQNATSRYEQSQIDITHYINGLHVNNR